MVDSRALRRSARYAVPVGVAAVIAAALTLPQHASGADHPELPDRTAAQLVAAFHQADPPDFTGTTVETSRLGLPALPENLAGPTGSATSQAMALLTGSHTAKVASGGPDRQRVAVFLDDTSELDLVRNGHDVWTYTSNGNAVTHSLLPDHDKTADDAAPTATPSPAAALDPTTAAQQFLSRLDPTTAVTLDPTTRIADRPAYQLVLAPRDSKSLIGSVRIALDSATSLPLRVQVWPRATSTQPAFEVAFTSLSLHTPSASTFAFTAPPGARTSEKHLDLPDRPDGTSTAGIDKIGQAWTAVASGPMSAFGMAPDIAPPDLPTDGPRRHIVSRGNDLASMVNQLGTAVPGGRLLRTTLLSVLLTDDGRLFLGAVDPTYLQTLANQGTGR